MNRAIEGSIACNMRPWVKRVLVGVAPQTPPVQPEVGLIVQCRSCDRPVCVTVEIAKAVKG